MKAKIRGVARLEVLMAMAVLALGLITAGSLQVQGTQVFASAGRESQALQLAQGMLERVRAAGHLPEAEALRWQAQVEQQLGPLAEGRVSRAGEALRLEVQWLQVGAAQVLNLQGHVLP